MELCGKFEGFECHLMPPWYMHSINSMAVCRVCSALYVSVCMTGKVEEAFVQYHVLVVLGGRGCRPIMGNVPP